MANADFSREQNQMPGGFDSGSYREAKRPDNETVRLTPLQQKLAGLEKALPTAMAKQGTALVLSVAVMLAAFVGFGGAKVRGKYNEARQWFTTGVSADNGYALNEYNAICDIFKRGDTALDNNYIERIQRYISLSRRNSMFFGSHEGASRAAILYSIAISCRLNGINLFEYICDVIKKTAEWQPNTPLEKYRNLLPDRWKKQ